MWYFLLFEDIFHHHSAITGTDRSST